MRVKPLPKSWLIHSMTYEEYVKRDDWGNEGYGPLVIINHVRFDNKTVFSRDNTQNRIVAEGVIYVDARHSTPLQEFKERSRINVNGKRYVLQKVIPCYHPEKNEIRHYELEVI
ncbi:putative minor capsid protein [Alkalihalobacillus trypoxylicola]|uniref:Minor capsid protein n=1 Tax=Alkalihalobacillus trypoxylicola TaxID=519424 RepID=A0A161PZK7_9BACI|nr:putative minor capsid protein [Alkalihalobacillus trypoxylicola]KYG28175.1 hypothetical protein AZF04_09745 [Alkalihalobacillus trypoxylicola]